MIRALLKTATGAAKAAVIVGAAKAGHDASVRLMDWGKRKLEESRAGR